MQKINYVLAIVIISMSQLIFAQEKEELRNWHLQDYTSEQRGINVEKAYRELLSNKNPQEEIIVAVIDSGVDINHEDLNQLIWTNEDEIPNNGIDDDSNGYIDDIHGWNFLGNANGDNVGSDNLEVTRLYKAYSERFEGKSASDISKSEQKDWQDYQRAKKEYEESLEKAQKSYEGFLNFKASYDAVNSFFTEQFGEDFTSEQAMAYEPKNEDEAKMKGFYSYTIENDVDDDYIKRYEEYVTNQAKIFYNTDIDVRRDIIKDDPNNLKEKGYGNNDVIAVSNSHGTHVAGIIGAMRNNDIGMNGIANNIKIMAVRAVPDGDEHDKDVANAIRYAVDNGARVINMSFGKSYSPNEKLVADAIQYAEDHDVILVHAAGNSSENLDKNYNFPTNYSDYIRGKVKTFITVGASSINPDEGFVAGFSNYGEDKVDIFAPGVDIYSTYPNNEYQFNNGTSMAAPVVSGVAALILSYYPDLSGKQVKKIIEKSAHDLSDASVYLPGSGGTNENGEKMDKSVVEFEDLSKTGGLIDAYAALIMADKKSKY